MIETASCSYDVRGYLQPTPAIKLWVNQPKMQLVAEIHVAAYNSGYLAVWLLIPPPHPEPAWYSTKCCLFEAQILVDTLSKEPRGLFLEIKAPYLEAIYSTVPRDNPKLFA